MRLLIWPADTTPSTSNRSTASDLRASVSERIPEHFEGLIEPLLPATVLLVVGLRGHEIDELLKIILVAGEHDAPVGEARSVHEPFAGGIDQEQSPERCVHLSGDHDSDGGR